MMTALIYFPGSDKRDSGRTEVGHKLTAHKSTTVHNTTTDKHGSERERKTDRQTGRLYQEGDRQTEMRIRKSYSFLKEINLKQE